MTICLGKYEPFSHNEVLLADSHNEVLLAEGRFWCWRKYSISLLRKILQHENMTSVNEDSARPLLKKIFDILLEENFAVVKIFSTMRTKHQLQYIRLRTICLGKLWPFFTQRGTSCRFTQRGTSCRRALLMLKKIFDIPFDENFCSMRAWHQLTKTVLKKIFQL